MSGSIGQFWGINFYNHPVLHEKNLKEAEAFLGVRLPTELVELLRVQNGGYTRGFFVAFPFTSSLGIAGIELATLNGIVEPKQSPLSLLTSVELSEEWGLPKQQLLLSGDGHWWLTLDYRHDSKPCVRWVTSSGEDFLVAPDFGAFLRALQPSSEGDA